MSWPAPLRVVGVGSPCGDDAVGWEVVRRLRERPDLPRDIELIMVDGGQRLLDVLDGRGTLVLVDAVAAEGEPGTIHCLSWPDDRLETLRPGSTHDVNPAAALQLATTLGLAPPRIVVFGIEVERVDPESKIGPMALRAIGELVPCLVETLKGTPDPVLAAPVSDARHGTVG